MLDQRAALRPLSDVRAWTLAGVATLAMSVSYVDRQALAAISPTVCKALAIDHTQYGWLTSAFSMAYLVGAPLAGLIIDRVGARRGLMGAVVTWSAVAALHALAPTLGMLFALRIALGVAESPSFPGAAQTIRRAIRPERRSAAFGMLFTGSSIGATIAVPLAIAINSKYGWHAAFVGTATVGLSWLPLWWLATRSAHVRALLDARPDAPASSERISWPSLVVSPAVLRALVLVVANAPIMMFVLNWFPKFLSDAHGIPQDALAKYSAPPALAFDLGAVAFGALASRADRRAGGEHRSHVVLMAAAGVLSAMLALVPIAPGLWTITALASLSVAGVGGTFALLTADMLARVAPSRVSSAAGLTAAAQSLSYVCASPLVGMVVDKTGSYSSPIVALGMAAIPGALAWIVWPLPRRA